MLSTHTTHTTTDRSLQAAPAAEPVKPWSLPLPAGCHVGSAQILRTEDGQPVVRLSEGNEVRATWALPFHYAPEPGDMAWVIGHAGVFYVTGILQGRGRSRLFFRQDVAVRAVGQLRLRARTKLRVHGRQLQLRAKALEVRARKLQERFGDALRIVRGLTELRAGSSHRIVEGEDNVTAERVTILGADRVFLDADVIQVQ